MITEETLSQEFRRLVAEYRSDVDGPTGAEAWNLIADFAVDNSTTIWAALESSTAFHEAAAQADTPASTVGAWVMVPHDLLSHLPDWEAACTIALAHAEVSPPDIDDRSYWGKQLRTLSNIRSGLASPPAAIPMGIDAHEKPRYTTRRLRYEIDQAVAAAEARVRSELTPTLVPGEGALLREVIGDVCTFRDMQPEEDESWESWYYAAFDMLIPRLRETFARNLYATPPATSQSEGEATEHPFHVSKSSDGDRKWFSARDEAYGLSIPAKSRDEAYTLVSALNSWFSQRTAALASPPVAAKEAVEVKAITWYRPEKVHESVTKFRADCPFGYYEAWGGGGWNFNGGPNAVEEPRNIDGAKAAAQAHYNVIISNLSRTTEEEG